MCLYVSIKSEQCFACSSKMVLSRTLAQCNFQIQRPLPGFSGRCWKEVSISHLLSLKPVICQLCTHQMTLNEQARQLERHYVSWLICVPESRDMEKQGPEQERYRMMDKLRLALIGFGNVGQGFVKILNDRGEPLARHFGIRFPLVAVCDPIKGSVYHPEGLLPATLLEAIHHHGTLDALSAPRRGWDAMRTIEESNADVIIEVSPTNLETGEPATSYLSCALKHGRHIITTNKGPIALHYRQLKTLAQAHHCEMGIEGTVMSGTPVLRLAQHLRKTDEIQRIQGIVNGTTNYILTQMQEGMNYAQALREAQRQGYAETDPRGDVEGYDAAAKMVILANLLMGGSFSFSDVRRTGMTHLTPRDMDAAQAKGLVWKLLGTIEKYEARVTLSVCPRLLPLTHPL